MTKLCITTVLGGAWRVTDADGNTLATFAPGDNPAYGAFLEGLSRLPNASLFNQDSGQFIIGTLGELV
jgi:hypothetical protein